MEKEFKVGDIVTINKETPYSSTCGYIFQQMTFNEKCSLHTIIKIERGDYLLENRSWVDKKWIKLAKEGD